MSQISRDQPMSAQIMKMLTDGISRRQIESDLKEAGHDEYLVKCTLDECLKLHNYKKRTAGMMLIVAGALCCFGSFLLTITSLSLSRASWELFGLTTIGIVLVFAGLVRIFA